MSQPPRQRAAVGLHVHGGGAPGGVIAGRILLLENDDAAPLGKPIGRRGSRHAGADDQVSHNRSIARILCSASRQPKWQDSAHLRVWLRRTLGKPRRARYSGALFSSRERIMEISCKGRRAVVTAGGSGIGRVIADDSGGQRRRGLHLRRPARHWSRTCSGERDRRDRGRCRPIPAQVDRLFEVCGGRYGRCRRPGQQRRNRRPDCARVEADRARATGTARSRSISPASSIARAAQSR